MLLARAIAIHKEANSCSDVKYIWDQRLVALYTLLGIRNISITNITNALLIDLDVSFY